MFLIESFALTLLTAFASTYIFPLIKFSKLEHSTVTLHRYSHFGRSRGRSLL